MRLNSAAPEVLTDGIPPLPPCLAPPVMATRAVARRERLGTIRHPHVLSEELFRGSLIRHRQRVDRTNRPLVVMSVALNGRFGADITALWQPIVESIAAATG